MKLRLRHRCFHVNFAKFLTAHFFLEHLRCLLLTFEISSTILVDIRYGIILPHHTENWVPKMSVRNESKLKHHGSDQKLRIIWRGYITSKDSLKRLSPSTDVFWKKGFFRFFPKQFSSSLYE